MSAVLLHKPASTVSTPCTQDPLDEHKPFWRENLVMNKRKNTTFNHAYELKQMACLSTKQCH